MSAPQAPILRALERARLEWLAGDRTAWTRYTECLALLETHLRSPVGNALDRSRPGVGIPTPGRRPAGPFRAAA